MSAVTACIVIWLLHHFEFGYRPVFADGDTASIDFVFHGGHFFSFKIDASAACPPAVLPRLKSTTSRPN